MVGSLIYLIATRPNLMYAFSLISRFMESPKTLNGKLEKEFRDMLQPDLDMDFGTLIHQTVLSQGTLTVISQVVLMIGKTHMVMLSIWVQI